MNKPANFRPRQGTRRDFLLGATMAGGALLVGCAPRYAIGEDAEAKIVSFGSFVKIAPDGAVTVVSKHSEWGQGSSTGLGMIVAEELDADWSKVRIEQAPADPAYKNTFYGIQVTGGSSAIANSWEQFRRAGAGARAMFVQAAAARWKVPSGEIAVKDSLVSHPASGKQATFADLLVDAGKITPPENPVLKDPKNFVLIGQKRALRKDSLAKSTGAARFTQDVQKPGLLIAMVAHAPRFGAVPKSFDDSEARKVSGVVDVFQISNGVAVVAKNSWAARQGRDAVKINWDESKAETMSSDQQMAEFRALTSGHPPRDPALKWEPFETHGDVKKPPKGKVIEASFEFPYLAHATMEPMNCVAELHGGKALLTFAAQMHPVDQANAAKAFGLEPAAVQIETVFAGGSFGRRATNRSEYVVEAAQIAKKLGEGHPVKLVWTREDDMHGGYYRPPARHAVRVVVDKEGYPIYWRHRLATQSIGLTGNPVSTKFDETAVEGVENSAYFKAIPNVDAQVLRTTNQVPVHYWRSVGHSHTAFAMEHMIDQLARKAGKDPVEYRRALYEKASAERHLAALNLAAEKASWDRPAPAGWTRGVAVHENYNSVVAQVVEVKIENGAPKVGRVVVAIDCGIAIAPDQIAAQMEGSVCFGLSAALYGRIDIKNGAVQQSNFDSYRILRHSEAPKVETYIVPSNAAPTGVGEPAVPVIAPAVANAILAATGMATKLLPFVRS